MMDGIRYRNLEELVDSGIEWLGMIPKEWEIKRFKYFAYCYPSNVDKKEYPNQHKVKLCNYVDVYYNTFITNKIDFMEATANCAEIKKFSLQRGDIVITKDSETPDDIAIPAFVSGDIPNLVCGYHLSIIRVLYSHCSKYFFYLLRSNHVRGYFETRANGVTRFGLPASAFKEIALTIPNNENMEQQKISNFLDFKTSQFDSIVEKKEQLMQKLEEAKKSLISEVVTGKVKIVDGALVEREASEMKDSGIKWLGKIPRDWIVTKIKFFFDIQLGKMLQPEKKLPSDVEKAYLCTINVDWSGLKTETIKTMWFQKNEIEKFLAIPNDIIINEGGDAGKACILNSNNGSYHIQNAVHRIRERGKVPNKYLYYWLFFLKSIQYVDLICNKATIMHLTSEKLKNLEIPYEISSIFNAETKIISNFLDYKTTQFESMIEKQKSFIEKLKQAKQSLISEAVTGKIDLRDWQIIEEEVMS